MRQKAVQQLEELRQQEEEDFQKALEASQKLSNGKDAEIEDLRADVIQLKTSLDEHESKNFELMKSVNSLESNEKTSKAKLLDDLRQQEESFAFLQERSNVEGELKSTLKTELEKLNIEIENLRERNHEMAKEHQTERQQTQGRIEELLKNEYQVEFLSRENENLKADIEYFLTDRKDQQGRYEEMSKLRSEIANLRYRQRKLEEERDSLQRDLGVAKQQNSLNIEDEADLKQEADKFQVVAENRKLRLEIENLELKMKQNNTGELENENLRLKLELNSSRTISADNDSSYLLMANNENQRLKEQIEMLESKLGQQPSLDELIDENRSLKEQLNSSEESSLRMINRDLLDENHRLKEQLQRESPRKNEDVINENRRLVDELEEAKRKINVTPSSSSTSYDSQILNALTRENNILKQDVKALEMMRAENMRLKTDLDKQQQQQQNMSKSNNSSENVLNNQRQLQQQQQQQLENLRKQNIELHSKAGHVNEITNENRMLKQELREIENKHIASNERLFAENKTLKKQVDELFKKNQDLELSNISPVPTNSSMKREESHSLRQKAASFDNLSQASWNLSSSLNKSASIENLAPSPINNKQKRQNTDVTPSASFELKQKPLNQSASFERNPLSQSSSFERQHKPTSRSGSFERFSQPNQQREHSFNESNSFDQLAQRKRQSPLNQSDSFKKQRQSSLNQSNSFERLQENTPSQSGLFERLVPANQHAAAESSQQKSPRQFGGNLLERTPSFMTDSSKQHQQQPRYNFPPDTPYVKQIRVRFAGDENNQQQQDQIKTSPQIKTIINHSATHQQEQQQQQQQQQHQQSREKEDDYSTYTPTPRPETKTTSSLNRDWRNQLSEAAEPLQQKREANPWTRDDHQTRQPTKEQKSRNIAHQNKPNENQPRQTSSSAKSLLTERPDVSQLFSLISFDESPAGNKRESTNQKSSLLELPTIATIKNNDGGESSGGLKRTPSIKDNPFFERDRSKRQSKSENSSPVKPPFQQHNQQQPQLQTGLPKEILKFDMRPKSTPPSASSAQRVQDVENEGSSSGAEIGNNFVKRLKGVFENNKDVKGR